MAEEASVIPLNSTGLTWSPRSNDKILTYYPPRPAIGSMAITRENCECLEEGQYLNDVIIDFYLSYLTRETLLPDESRRIHLFSSFMFSRMARDDPSSAEPDSMEQRHAGVARWTKHVNIFAKDYIIVPINRQHHWFLAIICFPGIAVCQSSNTGGEFQKPRILMLNSIGAMEDSYVENILRGYLQYEYLAKHGEKKSFSSDAMEIKYLNVPRQTNATDCGLYVLQYAENFLKEPIKDYASGMWDLADWFEHDVIKNKRRQIRDLIKKLSGHDYSSKRKYDNSSVTQLDSSDALSNSRSQSELAAAARHSVTLQERYKLQSYEQTPVLPLVPKSAPINLDETASEAWSSSVLPNDYSEWLFEDVTDDTASVARSDDTARSEIESRGEPEGGKDTPPPVNQLLDNSGTFFRPIRDDIVGRSTMTVLSSPTTPLSPSSHNVTGRGGTRSDYRRSTREYVDRNANSISDSAFGKPNLGEDGLVNLIDKLQMDGVKSAGDGQESTVAAANRIGEAAIAPPLLLANNIGGSASSSPKLPNGDVKAVSQGARRPKIKESRVIRKRAAASPRISLEPPPPEKKIRKKKPSKVERREHCDKNDPLYNLSIDALYNDSRIDPRMSYQEFKRRKKIYEDDLFALDFSE